ncbi:MAG: hypothetical protein KatS3mg045_0356 [Bellilinea sp.]|nr:MAG: hypothetical protein KatS3mg045_0356 [Bellilinea sp.]
MAETELNDIEGVEEPRPRRLRWDWLLPVFFRPGRTMHAVSQQEKGVWLAPLLVLSLLALIVSLAGGPARAAAAQPGGELPPDFQYWPPEQQEQYFQSQQNRASPLVIYGLPALGALAGIWVGWFLLGSILHLALTMVGSRGSNTAALNLAAWASMPFAIRFIVQAVYMLTTQQVIQAPGLSGFIAADAAGFAAFLRPLLAHVDVYTLWMIILLLIGAAPLTGLGKGKTWAAVILSVLLLLALQALPGYIASRLSGLNPTRMFF